MKISKNCNVQQSCKLGLFFCTDKRTVFCCIIVVTGQNGLHIYCADCKKSTEGIESDNIFLRKR